MPGLDVDGQTGDMTRRAACAARMGNGLPESRDPIEPGSDEERALMSATGVGIPEGARTNADHWAVISQTCQVIFFGEGESGVKYVFPTSTGLDEFPTREGVNRATAYDPALENTAAPGWHDSTNYPSREDNPLEGNMYKPIYFDGGQAIHGANTVPPHPASHGCARLDVPNQDTVVNWLGLSGLTEKTYDKGVIGLTVTVRGDFVAN
jgi:hypothetical protein